ncbi:DNA repair protein RadC [Sporosarcina sp. Marseille-Q4063]|uniref:RadC family protein n=1 Tax=Sporosarcina sp. Marseille-Q4063 TaxID=2810514 RepID=UPI001BB04D03|nr:DNA repair protein RadC [Sporosarcina sp. Marseille-Q4063]QUW20923.1 DNA repair protein RadC [Sporosarcina sp. Marseille-Q4063]
MTTKKYINSAREAVASYNAIGSESVIELQDILAVLIGPSSTPEFTGRLAGRGIRALVEMTVSELEGEGMTHNEALKVHSGMLLAKKARSAGKNEKRYTIRSPEDAASYLMAEMTSLTQEHFVVLYLNVKNEVLHKRTVFIGSLNSSIVHPREVYKEAVKHSAASVICAHNHPSGTVDPSHEDIEVTKRLAEAGSVMGVELLDHIIIGDYQFISLKEKGYM